ncbi:hypothetical protein LV35_04190 [Acinetobacter baumannii]|uniref:Uncharacterized protein n=1 Tax=Acinetobacter baumannii TaxID=470 RepID=A0AAJ0QSC9_ACIBA|nr:hypothetical protein LV35_04190 [Acinetobacter baumannii]
MWVDQLGEADDCRSGHGRRGGQQRRAGGLDAELPRHRRGDAGNPDRPGVGAGDVLNGGLGPGRAVVVGLLHDVLVRGRLAGRLGKRDVRHLTHHGLSRGGATEDRVALQATPIRAVAVQQRRAAHERAQQSAELDLHGVRVGLVPRGVAAATQRHARVGLREVVVTVEADGNHLTFNQNRSPRPWRSFRRPDRRRPGCAAACRNAGRRPAACPPGP